MSYVTIATILAAATVFMFDKCVAIRNSYIPPRRVVSSTLMCKTTPQEGMQLLLPRGHHCRREIWATFSDVA